MSNTPSGIPPRPAHMPPAPPEQPEQPYVGSAHMREDGTLELRLRAEAPGEILGEAMFIVKPDDPRHAGLVDHLGGISAGGYAPVRPIPSGVL